MNLVIGDAEMLRFSRHELMVARYSTISRATAPQPLTTTHNTMSGTPGPSNTGRAIASLAKLPADTTRAGTQKMKFVPTLPIRRKKEYVRPPLIHSSYIAYPRALGKSLPYKPPQQAVHPLIVPPGAKRVVEGAATHREGGVEPHPRDRPSTR
jgi:hypothetical protein